MAKKLNPEEILKIEKLLPIWSLNEEKTCIKRVLTFKNFPQAIEFMTRVAEVAEELDHHPDWSNSYNKVEISLSTHSLKALSNLDLELARHIERTAQSYLDL